MKTKRNFDDAWLGLEYDDLLDLKNPLRTSNLIEGEEIQYPILRIMRNPKYVAWTCKVLFNIELLPSQTVILQQIWNHVFPMYIASRGFGKSFLLAVYAMLKIVLYDQHKVVIVGAAFRQSKVIFEYMDVIWKQSPLVRSICSGASGPRRDVDRCIMKINDSWAAAVPLGDGCLDSLTLLMQDKGFKHISKATLGWYWGNGKFNEADEHYDNGIKPTKIVKTKKGFSYEGTYNHKMKVLRNGKIGWVRTDEMQIGDHILIDRSYRWHEGNFKCAEEQAYALGSMIGDGCWTNKYRLGFATNDADHFAPYLHSMFPFKDWTQTADEQHWIYNGKQNITEWLNFWKLKSECRTKDKVLPETILSAPRYCMTACLQGLFDTDGTLQVQTAKGGTSVTVSFCNTSKELVQQMQYILLHYGIVACVTSRDRDDKWNTVYELLITGQNVSIFAKEINFRLKRKHDLLTQGLSQKIRNNTNGDHVPYVKDKMLEIAYKYSTTIDAVRYSKIKDRKKITRQLIDKFLLAYEYTKEPYLCELKELSNSDIYYDEITSIENSKTHTYDIHIPNGHEYCANGFFSHNTKIRGLRANTIMSDEFNSIPPDIYETVVAGFTAVSADPIQNVKEAARRKAMKEEGQWTKKHEEAYTDRENNQAIISGTAGYSFQHYATYWNRYKAIIKSRGNFKKLAALLGEEELPEHMDGLDWTDFCVIRIPYELIPEGFMDSKQVLRAKATIHSGIYQMEYGAVFTADSQGFFKRSLIEACVAHEKNIDSSHWPHWCPLIFDAKIRGNEDLQYVYGIDPASEDDNLALIIVEIHPEHQRVVYAWTTNRRDFKERQKLGLTDCTDYNAYCSRKIRDLMKVFPCARIGIDSQGGGHQLVEALHDPDKMQHNEVPLWEIIEPDKEKDTDLMSGLHIIEVINFAKSDWTSNANHGLRKDMEDKIVLFPRFDTVTLGLAAEVDKQNFDQLRERIGDTTALKLYDTLEDCVMEIEELKDELCTIVMTQTGIVGRDRWDTPEIKLPNGKKGRLRKDRYSALVIANKLARDMHRALPDPEYSNIGRAVGGDNKSHVFQGQLYAGSDWAKQFTGKVCRAVRRG